MEAEKVRRSAPCYWLSEEQKLYKRSYSGPYLLCVHLEAVEPILEELHEGGVLNPLSSLWPFAKWDLDIVGPFPRAFDSKAFRRYCGGLGIRNGYSTPTYPQGNGQAKATNKVILAGLKKRLDDAKGRWVEELPYVLWTYRTTLCRSTGETPFSMTYGIEAIIPLELGFPTLRFE
ncbi:uncharacterized protein LOC142635889 [Castanea sativa]|uniref:uncharacterized protein LOC142635889 n=1 Tax=Castanea sativa TaxID=21020 RepID=UPI003F65116E